jgi:hypothetical protein
MVIFIMQYEITDKGPKLLTKIINITENSGIFQTNLIEHIVISSKILAKKLKH